MLKLNFHHHTILVRSNESIILEKLGEEFDFFMKKDALTTSQSEIFLEKSPPPPIPSLVANKILENAIIYSLGSIQYIDYFGEALTIWDSSQNKVHIYSENESRLHELGFLAIHSLLGQNLDTELMCRVHAMAVSLKNKSAVVMLPSKGGKSTLLKTLLNHPEIQVISDDMPLVDSKGRVHPFPAKLSFHEIPTTGPLSKLNWHEFKRHHYPTKWTASLSQLSDRIDQNPLNNEVCLIAGFRLSNGQSILSPVSRWKMILPVMEHMIMGFGLPQILEMFLKFKIGDLLKLGKHAVLRSICAYYLIRNAKCFYFYMGPDIDYNSQLLLDLLNDSQKS